MTRFLIFVLVSCVLFAAWQMRPWPGEYATTNARLRGQASILPAITACPAVTSQGRFDWYAITSDAELETCLYHVAQSLQTPDAMSVWLQGQGFDGTTPYAGVEPVISMVAAVWPQADNPALRPYGGPIIRMNDRLMRLLARVGGFGFVVPARSYQIVLSYDKSGITQVDAGLLYL